jgi:hypothetical protein
MAVELDITEETAATALLYRIGRAVDIASVEVDLRAVVGGVVGAPARRFLRDGICVIVFAEVEAETVRLVDADVCNRVSTVEFAAGSNRTHCSAREAGQRTSIGVCCIIIGAQVERYSISCYQGCP